MKIRTTKIIALLMAVSMLFVLFTGCKSKGDTSSDNSDVSLVVSDVSSEDTGTSSNEPSSNEPSSNVSSEDTGTSSNKPSSNNSSKKPNATTKKETSLTWNEVKATIPKKLRGTTITVYSWNDVTDVTGAKDVIANFTKETGIKVSWKKGTGTKNYTTEIAAMVAGKEAPDIVRLKDYDLGLLGLLMPLDKTGYNFNDTAWDDSVMKFYTCNGKAYATNMKNTLLQQPKCLLYNRSLINKYDLEDPYSLWKKGKWTWDKFIEVCTDFKKQADSSCLAWTSYTWADCADLLGAGYVKFDGKTFKNNMGSADLLKGWQMMADVQEKGLSNNMRFDRTGFEGGKVLFFTESLIGSRRTHYYFASLKASSSLAAVPMPTVEGYKDIQMYGEYEAYGIPAASKNALAAAYFLRYYLDAENYDEKTFFSDRTMLEVYKAQRANNNIYCNYDSAVITEDVGKNAIDINVALVNANKSQLKTTIDSYVSQVEAGVKSSNSKLSKIGK